MVAKRIVVIIPAYNESGNIKKTVEAVLSLSFHLNDQSGEKVKSSPSGHLNVLVVDDGSGDETGKIARQAGALVISLPFNLGIGGAVQTGFKYARDEGFDIAIQVDGDGQHDVEYLEKLIEPILHKGVDMTIGSRFLPPHLGYRSSFIRRIGIHFFAHLISFLTQCKLTDPTSGFRAYNRRMIKAFAEDYPHDFPEPEAIVVAKRLNAKILEVPVVMHKRKTGSSSIRYLVTFYYMIKVTFAILLNMIKRKRVLS